MKPKKTAAHLFIPTFSDKKNIDATVTNIGPPKVRETTSAKGSSLNAMKIATRAIKPDMHLNECRPGLLV